MLQLTEDDTITSGSQVIRVGYPIYSYYVPKFAGVDPANGQPLYWAYDMFDRAEAERKVAEGKPLKTNDGRDIVWLESAGQYVIDGKEYLTSDKTKATNSKYFRGSREPLCQGSFSSDFQFGPVDFSFLTTFSVGGVTYDSRYAGTREVTYAGDTGARTPCALGSSLATSPTCLSCWSTPATSPLTAGSLTLPTSPSSPSSSATPCRPSGPVSWASSPCVCSRWATTSSCSAS